MIACHCRAVSDRTVMDAIADGARDIEAIGDACGAGTRCGGCHDTLADLLETAWAVDEAFGEERPVPMPTLARRVREAA